MKKQKKKTSFYQIFSMIISVVIGAVFGVILSEFLIEQINLCELIVMFVSVVFAIYIHIIIHEAGHLVFGLLTGYKFCSFRIMNFTWIKEKDKIKFKKLSIAGTAGQCLLSPPDMKDGKFPVAIYNLGGIFMNIIVSLVFLLFYLLFREVSYISVIMSTFTAIGFITVITNGIPLYMNGVNNDGYNTISIMRNKNSRYTFWLQLKINQLQSDGMRLKDISEKWFEYPSYEDMNNNMVATIGVFCCNRMMDNHDFEIADKTMTELLESDAAIIGLHRQLLICDMIYCKLISGNTDDAVELMDKKQKKFMKSMKTFPSVMRTEYAYALICEKDTEKAEKIKTAFEKRISTYPYSGEAESEQELMEIVGNYALNKA